jgi:ribonuclease BN (tRNA processing enzyme)
LEIRFLGVHNLESAATKLVSLLVDGVLAVDAGSITTSLTFKEQQRIKSILITHHHFDHVRDLATLGLANLDWGTKKLYCPKEVLDVIFANLLSGVLYPDMTQKPSPESPSLLPCTINEGELMDVDGYNVQAWPVSHGIPTFGYEITDKQGKSVFYTSDTTQWIENCWQYISPDLLVIETTLPNSMKESAIESKHMCPSLLKDTLLDFSKAKGYIPPTVVVHINPMHEEQIGKEITAIGDELDADILMGYEGMTIVI